MENLTALLSSLNISLPALESLDPTTLKIVLSAAGVFLFLILFAFTRRHLVHASLRGLWAGLGVGMILVLGIEGGGYYLYTNYVVGQKAKELPKNFQVVVNDTANNLTRVLGTHVEKKQITAGDVVSDYRLLDATDSELARNAICREKQK